MPRLEVSRAIVPILRFDKSLRSLITKNLLLMFVATWSTAQAQEFVFETPSDDRWHYPFNFTPGVRPLASCFGAAPLDGFNDRDGQFFIAWDTSTQIEPGLGHDAYSIVSIQVTLTNQTDAEWFPDVTVDEWYTFDLNGDGFINLDGIPRGEPGDTDGESTDHDPGRPIELYGLGFGPFHTPETWTEFSFYVGSDSINNNPRDPFPFTFQEDTLNVLHVEDNVKGLHNEEAIPPVFQFTPVPWAIGEPVGYVPGKQTAPFDVVFKINLNQHETAVRDHFQEMLDAGKLFIAVTALTDVVQQGPSTGFPSFFTKEGVDLEPGAKAPSLTIVLGDQRFGDYDGDGDVDIFDFAGFQDCFDGPGSGYSDPRCASFDIEPDGDVDLLDFGAFQAQFGQT